MAVRINKEGDVINEPFTAATTWGYARKTTAGDGSIRSIEDQNEVNMETSEEYGLHLSLNHLLAEKPGLGGDLYWEGYQGTGLLDENGDHPKTRPELTKLVRGVQAGTVRCIVVYALERLWRNVSICHALIDLFAEKGCRLFDRTGEVNITTPEGRQAVLSAAVASQHMREKTGADARRGWRKNREKNRRNVSANVLGFANAPKGPGSRGKVIHVPHEQELVRRIFQLYDTGENGQAPLSFLQIAKLLQTEGMLSTLKDKNRHGRTRGEGNEETVYVPTIACRLKDVRYQGMQRHFDIVSPCPAFLTESGEPVVSPAVWDRVQAKINDRRRGGLRSRNSTYSLSGLMRCGVCAQSMSVGRSRASVDGVQQKVGVWDTIRNDSWSWCTHPVSKVRVDCLEEYVVDILAPLLLAEVQERLSDSGSSALLDRVSSLRHKLENNTQAKHDLAGRVGKLDDEILNMRAEALRTERMDFENQLMEAEDEVTAMRRMANFLTDAKSITGELRAEALKSVLRWVAVVPSDKPRIRDRSTYYKWLLPEDAGRVVFLTSWGTLHTAFISLSHSEGQERRVCSVRAAKAEEVIGTVNELPDPAAFLAGLTRSYKIRKHNYSRDVIMPGYLPDKAQQRVATFEIEATEVVEPTLS